MIKTLSKLGIEENLFNMIKFTYKKSIAHIFNGEMLSAFSLSSEQFKYIRFHHFC